MFDRIEGECLFTRPFSDTSDVFRHNKEVVPLLEKAKKSGDDRSLVIISALIIEYLTDKLLESFIPAYDKYLGKNTDFTFSNKQALLSSTQLIPRHIIDCSTITRKIRNEFAHNLEIDSLDRIEKRIIDSMKTCILKIPIYNKEKIPTNCKKLFEKIQFVAINGLSLYRQNVKILTEVMRSQDFLIQLKNQNEKSDRIYEEFMRTKPAQTLLGGGKITVFNEKDFKKWKEAKYKKKSSE